VLDGGAQASSFQMSTPALRPRRSLARAAFHRLENARSWIGTGARLPLGALSDLNPTLNAEPAVIVMLETGGIENCEAIARSRASMSY